MGNFFCFLILGMFFVVAQSTVLAYWGVGGLRIELLLIVLTYLALYHALFSGCFLVATLGYLYGLNSAAPFGLHVLTFLICFILLNLIRSRLYIQGEVFCIGLVAAMVVLHELVQFAILISRGMAFTITWKMLGTLIPKALLSGAFWPLLRPLMAFFDQIFPLPYSERPRSSLLDSRF